MQNVDFSMYDAERINLILNKISNNKIISNEIFDNSFVAINIFFKWIKSTVKVYLHTYQNDNGRTNVIKKIKVTKKTNTNSSKIINNNLLFRTSNGSSGFTQVTKYPFESSSNSIHNSNYHTSLEFKSLKDKEINPQILITNTRLNTNTNTFTHPNTQDDYSKLSQYHITEQLYITEYANVDTSINNISKSKPKSIGSKLHHLPLIPKLHETSLKLGKFEKKKLIRNDDNFIQLMNAGNFIQLKKAFDMEKKNYYMEKEKRVKVTQDYVEEIEKRSKKKIKLKDLGDLSDAVMKGALTKIDENFYKKFLNSSEVW